MEREIRPRLTKAITRRARVSLALAAIVFLIFPLGYGLVWSIIHGPPEAAIFLSIGAGALSLIALGILIETKSDVLIAWGIFVTGSLMMSLSAYLILTTLLGNGTTASENLGVWVLLMLFGIVVVIDGRRRFRSRSGRQ